MPAARPIFPVRRLTPALLFLPLLSLLGCGPEPASGTASPLEGAWQLVDVVGIDSTGKAGAAVPDPGLVIFSGSHFSRTWTDTTGQAATFALPWAPTDSEKLSRFGVFTASAGRFEIAGDTIIFRPISAKISSFEGGYSRDLYAIQGDTLSLTMTSIVSSNGMPVGFYASGGRQRQRLVRVK
jgi:hypothetical protein